MGEEKAGGRACIYLEDEGYNLVAFIPKAGFSVSQLNE